MPDIEKIIGTSEMSFEIGINGPILKSSGIASLDVRNSTDTNFATINADTMLLSHAPSPGSNQASTAAYAENYTNTQVNAMAATLVPKTWTIGASPILNQADQTAPSTNGATYSISAQNATGVTSIGGNVQISGGTGTTKSGKVTLATGATAILDATTDVGIGASCRLFAALELAGGFIGSRAATGDIRADNNRDILAAKSNLSGDVTCLAVNASDQIIIGTNKAVSSTVGKGVLLYNGTTIRLDTTSTKPTITGALSAVTDANAKAILTSIIAALKAGGINVAIDATT